MLNRVMIKFFFYSLCICGFLYQASKISTKYFNYGVQTKTRLVLPEEFFIKDYAICVRYTDLILGNDFIDAPEFALSTMSNNTLRHIFDSIPKPDDILDDCIIRNSGKFAVYASNHTSCGEIFMVTRFIYRENVCYELHYRNESKFTSIRIARSYLFAKMVYYFTIRDSSPLNHVHLLSASAYYSGDWIQYVSLELTNDIWTQQSAKARFNYFTTRYQYYEMRMLEPPYETKCYRYGNSSRDMCIMDCLKNRSIGKLDAIPVQIVIPDDDRQSLDWKQLDERNASASIIVNEIIQECKSIQCSMIDCDLRFTSSDTSKDLRPALNTSSFLLGMASTPDTIVIGDPDVAGSEYVLYLLSLAGSWFGFSIIALDPYEILQKFRYRKSNQNGNVRNRIANDSDIIFRDGDILRMKIQLLTLKHENYLHINRLSRRLIVMQRLHDIEMNSLKSRFSRVCAVGEEVAQLRALN